MINKINSNMSTWWAGRNEHFEGWTWDEARRLFGTRMVNPEGVNMPVRSHDDIDMNDIPASFDARQQWPQYIHPIRDQARCGSCWAFAASEVLSDRFAIQSSGSVNVVLSPEDLVSCDQSDMGCQGGYLANAWKYLSDSGIVTDKCFPYGAQAGTPPQCVSKCEDGEAWKKYKAKNLPRSPVLTTSRRRSTPTAPSRLASTCTRASCPTSPESTSTTGGRSGTPLRVATPSRSSAGARRTARTTGCALTPGPPPGVRTASSRSSRATVASSPRCSLVWLTSKCTL